MKKVVKDVKRWLKEDKKNIKLTVHLICVLLTVGITFWITRSFWLSSGPAVPMFAQEGSDFIAGI